VRPWVRGLRLAGLALVWSLGAQFTVAVGDALYSTTLPALRPWHTVVPEHEFEADQAGGGYGWNDWLAQEARLFDEVRALRAVRHDPAADGTISRYAPDGGPYAARLAQDWNRTFVRRAPDERAVALLLHGLSDSPYSMRGLAEALHARGVTVYGLRLPGHGTLPSGLDAASWRDWLAAVEIAVRHVRREHPDTPFFIAGYSTGATLALKFSADAVGRGRLDLLPRRLLLMSPALGVSPFAPLANVQRLVSRWGIAPKARWADVGLEIDPFKYTSFAKNAGAQIASLIRALLDQLERMDRDGSIGRLPPVTSFQSMVDATVSTSDLAGRFYGLLRGGTSELVLFDLNRRADVAPLLAFSPKAVLAAFERAPRRDYRLTVLGNDDGAPTLTERSWAPGATRPTERPLSLAWPEDVYSLSHVAMPFPPDDPLYGLRPGRGADGLPSLGALAWRGERGALAIGAADQLRLRSNPFFDDMVARMSAAIDADLAAR
ncbi:MAG: alpha/beta fold hydrolase, partial [Burkholderiales bacterium]